MPALSLLSDIKVADMTSALFGPYCTQTLADMGADVVKMESTKGDMMRQAGKPANTKKMGPAHITLNRGKRCVNWDPKTALGKEATRRLIERSDIFIHNIRYSAIKRLGLTFDDVKAINNKIVYVSCTGFASDGPYAGRPAFDDIIQCYSGMASLMPRLDGNEEPRILPTTIADKVSGLHAVYAVLAALRRRDQTGTAVNVEVPMLECVTHFLLEEHFDSAIFDPPKDDFGLKRCFDASLNPMQTKNSWIMLAPYGDARWIKIFEVLGASKELENDVQLDDYKKRYYNREYMYDRVKIHLLKNTTEYWLKAFDKAQVPVARVNQLEDLLEDPHLKATNFFQKRVHPTEGAFWEIQPPVRFEGVETKDIEPARHVGEDTDDILKELGLKAQAPE